MTYFVGHIIFDLFTIDTCSLVWLIINRSWRQSHISVWVKYCVLLLIISNMASFIVAFSLRLTIWYLGCCISVLYWVELKFMISVLSRILNILLLMTWSCKIYFILWLVPWEETQYYELKHLWQNTIESNDRTPCFVWPYFFNNILNRLFHGKFIDFLCLFRYLSPAVGFLHILMHLSARMLIVVFHSSQKLSC